MKSIYIRAFPPYQSWLGGQSELAIQVEGPIPVRELWARLARAYPRFRELQACWTDEELSRAIVVLQDGRQLGPADQITSGVRVELLPSIAGGKPGNLTKVVIRAILIPSNHSGLGGCPCVSRPKRNTRCGL
jgi:hypothetical protein